MSEPRANTGHSSRQSGIRLDFKTILSIIGISIPLIGGFTALQLQANAASSKSDNNKESIVELRKDQDALKDYFIEEQRRAEDHRQKILDKIDRLLER